MGTTCAELLLSKHGQRGSTCTRQEQVQLKHTLFASKGSYEADESPVQVPSLLPHQG